MNKPYLRISALYLWWELIDVSSFSGVAGIFFGGGGGTPPPLKGYHANPARGPGGGAKAAPDCSEVLFIKTMQSIRKWFHFSKIATFFLAKNPFFLRKISNIQHISQEFLSFFENYLNIWIFLEGLYKSREIPEEFYFYYLVETFIKKAQKMA